MVCRFSNWLAKSCISRAGTAAVDFLVVCTYLGPFCLVCILPAIGVDAVVQSRLETVQPLEYSSMVGITFRPLVTLLVVVEQDDGYSRTAHDYFSIDVGSG